MEETNQEWWEYEKAYKDHIESYYEVIFTFGRYMLVHRNKSKAAEEWRKMYPAGIVSWLSHFKKK